MQKILHFTIAALLLFSANGIAQEIKEIKKTDSTFVYKYGQGTFITLGKKNKSTLNFFGVVQSGEESNVIDAQSNSEINSRMSINLARLNLYGTFLDDKARFGLVTDYTGNKGLLEAWVGMSLYKKNVYLYFGERRTHTNNRLALEDERFAQNMAQTKAGASTDGIIYGGLMHNFVGTTREGGLFLETNFSIDQVRIYPSISVTTGDGQGFFDEQSNAGFKYGGRLDVMPLGDFIKNNAFISHDLYREKSIKVAVGFVGSYNDKASHKMGSGFNQITGIYEKDGTVSYADYIKIGTDFIIKYKGFSFIGEYTNASVNGENLYLDTTGKTLINAETAAAKYNMGYGVNLQSSYVTKSGWAFDARYSFIEPEVEIEKSLVQKEKWYTVGINKYFKNNALKIGLNTSIVDREIQPETISNVYTNLAVQLTF